MNPEYSTDEDVGNKEFIPLPGRDHSATPHTVMGMEVDPTLMDNLWARELLELGIDERTIADEHLHGIRSIAVPETQELLSRTLNEMQMEIGNIPRDEKRGHIRGLELGSMYIQSLAFRLKFLRSVQFDAKTAAIRYCKCLDLLTELFGEAALMRRLYITDLGEEEINYMKHGQFQVLPSRDCMGRRIVVYNIRPIKEKGENLYSMECMFKVYVYMLHAIVSEDVSTQKHGLVYVGILHTNEALQRNESGTSDLHRVHKMYAGTPLFWGAVHLCVPNGPLYRLITALFLAWIGRAGRKVLRIHRGNRIECHYGLRSFGIPVGDVPQMHSGEIKTKNHMRLIKVRMSMDEWQVQQEKKFKNRRKSKKSAPEAIKPFPGIECPEVDFVVLSYLKNDDGAQNNHPGNIAFRKVMVQNAGFKVFLADPKDVEFDTHSKVLRVVDDVIFDACVEGLQFLIYEKEQGYYSEVVHQDVLRKHVEKVMRRYRTQFIAKQTRAKASSKASTQRTFDLTQNDNMDFCGCIR